MIQKLKETIILTASYYGHPISAQVLDMYVEDLQDLSLPAVIMAYREYRRDAKNTRFPLPAQIRGIVSPQVDDDTLAREAASRIQSAITKFGYTNPYEAKGFIGELGWRVVERQGGWTRLCEQHGLSIDPGTFMAQARDLLKSQIKLHKAGVLDHAPSLPAMNPYQQIASSFVRTIDDAISLNGGEE